MKDRKRVIAEITPRHLIRLCGERGYPVSREQALSFLNQEEHLIKMWKQMMRVAKDFIGGSLLRQYMSQGGPVDSDVGKFCQRSAG
jgi:hypothetical protein